MYVAGNSVARHWAFAMEQLLQNNSAVFGGAKGPVREAQIARCGSGSFGRRDNPIACQMTAGHNTSIVFGWAQRVHTPSLEAMLNGLVLQPDIAVLGMGSDDIWDPHRATHWSSIQQQEAPQLVRMLRRVVSRPAPPLLYWRTLTPNCATLNFSVKKTEQTNAPCAGIHSPGVGTLLSKG